MIILYSTMIRSLNQIVKKVIGLFSFLQRIFLILSVEICTHCVNTERTLCFHVKFSLMNFLNTWFLTSQCNKPTNAMSLIFAWRKAIWTFIILVLYLSFHSVLWTTSLLLLLIQKIFLFILLLILLFNISSQSLWFTFSFDLKS